MGAYLKMPMLYVVSIDMARLQACELDPVHIEIEGVDGAKSVLHLVRDQQRSYAFAGGLRE